MKRRMFTAECDSCGLVLFPGMVHQVVTSGLERFNRRGTVTVIDAEVLLRRCITCSKKQGVTVEVKAR